MSYRINGKKEECHPVRTVQKTSTPGTIYLTNGEGCRLAFPCYYQEILPPVYVQHHCRDWHDHIGMPSPNHPDHICQDWEFAWHHRDGYGPTSHHAIHRRYFDDRHICDNYLNMDSLAPIHLIDEGYERIFVQVSDSVSGLTAKGWIDEEDDWLIRILVHANIPNLDKKFETKFAIRADNKSLNKIDTVFLGRLVVLPSAMITLPTGG